MRHKRRWLAALFLLALVLALPLLLNLNLFRAQVHQAVERQLGRQVEFTSLTARLLPRPGMVGQGVMVYEREDFGTEPFLYADEVHCDLSLRGLWNMRLEFSQIRFLRPSINLVRRPDGAWNLATFLLASGGTRPASARPPVVSGTEARINFKMGVDKLVYTLTAARLQLAPLSEGRWQLQLQATPWRTDRRLGETGELRLEGELGVATEFSALPFRLQATLEDGSLAQLWALATGREPSLRAAASFAASLEGTPAEWRSRGSLAIANLRRWDLVAPSRTPRWESEFNLRYRSGASVLELEKLVVRAEQSEFLVRGQVENLFANPRWEVDLRAEPLLLGELFGQWTALKADVSPRTQIQGKARLTLGLHGPRENWRGELSAPAGFILRVPGLPRPVQVADLQLRLEGGRVELLPMAMSFSDTEALTLQGELSSLSGSFPYRLHWQSPGVGLDLLRQTAAGFGWDLVGRARWQGLASFDLEWHGRLLGEDEPRWQGEVGLSEVSYHPPEFNSPLEIVEARVVWQGMRVEAHPLAVRLGANTVTATLERHGRVGRWNVTIEAERLAVDDLDQLLNPGRQSFLARLVGRQPEETRWKKLSAVGSLRVEELTAGPFRLSRVDARGEWQSGWLELTRLRFRAYGGRFNGRLQADFRPSPPRYRLAGNLTQVELGALLAETTRLGGLFTGVLGADVGMETEGTRARTLLRQLQGRVVGVVHDGSLSHFNLLAAMTDAAGVDPGDDDDGPPTTPLQSLAGEFRVADQQVQFDGARIITSRTALELSGSVDFNGRLDLRLAGEPLRVAGRRPTAAVTQALSYSYRLTGSLREPQVAVAEALSPTVP